MNAPTAGGSLFTAFARMFSGTLVSRILGMVRLLVLLAALGTMGQADAFNVANGLPNTLYNLLAGGVMNAILVPQIVRAMQRKDGGTTYTNKLITLAGLVLFVATLILTVAAPLLIMIYAGAMDPGWARVATLLALWAIPEMFFYGLYTLFGNILNARGSFGPYMWAPVVNNLVAIAGLGVYIWIFGTYAATGDVPPEDWGTGRIALVGGAALLGVAAQALVLILPLRRSGVHFRPDFKFRGAGLSGISGPAKWAFAALLIGQAGFLMLSNVANAANGVAAPLQAAGDPSYLTIPTITAYTAAFAVYMLPQSLVTTSLVTAVFTSMSNKAAAGDAAGVREDMSYSMRVLGVFTIFTGAALMVLALPVVTAVLFTASPGAEPAFAAVLAALAFGIPGQSVWTVVQRVSFAYEDAKTLAKIQLPMSLLLIVFGIAALTLFPPQWWLVITVLGSSLAQYLGALMGYLALRSKLPSLDGRRILRTYVRLVVAMAPAALIGWVLLHFWGPMAAGGRSDVFVGGLARLTVIGFLMLGIYVLLLRAFRVEELGLMLAPIARKLRRGRGGDLPPGAVQSPPGQGASVRGIAEPAPKIAPGGTGTSTPKSGDEGEANGVQHSATVGLIAGRFDLKRHVSTLSSAAELWAGRDVVLDRSVTVLAVSRTADPTRVAKLLDAALRASLVDDARFARISNVGEVEFDGVSWAYVVSEDPTGTPLSTVAGRFDNDGARTVVAQVAAALDTAHRRGIKHGALSPELVCVTPAGVCISGLAFLAAATESSSDTAALGRLFAHLTGGDPDPQLSRAADPAAVVTLLSPWGGAAISLPATARVHDPDSWTLHPSKIEPPTGDFGDVVGEDQAIDPLRDSATHAATVLPAWKVFLPGTGDVAAGEEVGAADLPPPHTRPLWRTAGQLPPGNNLESGRFFIIFMGVLLAIAMFFAFLSLSNVSAPMTRGLGGAVTSGNERPETAIPNEPATSPAPTETAP